MSQLLETCGREPVIYEQEYDPALRFFRDDPYTITMEDDETFVVEGPKIEKCSVTRISNLRKVSCSSSVS